MAGHGDTPSGYSDGVEKPVGLLDNMPGFRGTLPIRALEINGDYHRGNDSVLALLLYVDPPDLRDRLFAIGTMRVISIVNLHLRERKVWLPYVRMRGTYTGRYGVHLDLFFDETAEVRQFVFHVNNNSNTYDPYSRMRD